MILAEYQRREVQGIILTGNKGVGKSRLAAVAAARLADVGCQVTSVGARRALRSTPFAAIAHLAPGFENGYFLLSQLIMRFRASGLSSGPVQTVIVLDDAHLLDEQSAAVLAELTARRLIYLIATALAGRPVPEALAELWSRGYVLRLPVHPLEAEAMTQLVDRVLPDDRVDAVGRHRFRRLAAGSPLALKLLVDAIHPTPDGLVRGLVDAWLAEVGPSARFVVDIVACSGPLPLHLLESLVDPPAVDAAEQAGLLRLAGDGNVPLAELVPPLTASVMRPLVTRWLARSIFSRLTDVLLLHRPLRGDDVLRAGTWQLYADRIREPEYLIPAARIALARSDLNLAYRLAEAARQADASPACDLLLAHVLVMLGHGRQAAALLPPPSGPVRSEASPDAEYATDWALVTAEVRYFGLGLPASLAESALGTTSYHRHRVEAKRSWIQLCDGRGDQALASAQSVLAQSGAGQQARIWAAAGGAAAAGLLGRRSFGEEIFRLGLAAVAASRGDHQWGGAQVGYGVCLARLLAGDLLAAQEAANQGYRDAVGAEIRPMAGIWAGLRGMVAKAQGRLRSAAQYLREALALLESDEPSGPFCVRIAALAELASVAAMTGDAPGAASWLGQADAFAGPRLGVFDPWIEVGRAWSLACAGELTRAIVRARRAADLAREQGHAAYEAIALYDAARLGGSNLVHARLAVLTRTVESEAVAAMAVAARALARADEIGLGRAADAFEYLGHLPLAAEIAAAAARVHHVAGRHSSAALLQERSSALAQRCEELRTPLLGRWQSRSPLTLREREVMLMAATLTTPQIAARLALSPRTVSNYLQRAYDKLGLAGRPALRLFLGGQWPEADQREPV